MKARAKSLIAVSAIAAVFGSMAFAAPAAASDKDWRVIKNAVREDSRPRGRRGEAEWFKIIITDRHSREENLKLTLPLSLVEGIVKMASVHSRDRHVRCRDFDPDIDIDIDIDFEEILVQLKKAGPMSLFEIRDDDALIKIWIE